MADQVNVTSLDAIEAFRASLILFISKARRSLDEVGDDLRRTRLWLQHDQRLFWGREIARRTKALSQAEQDLMSARFSELHDVIQVRQNAVLKAKRALAEAEAGAESVKTWNRNYDSRADPLSKKLEGLRTVLDQDMPKAIAYLVAVNRTLGEYAELPSAAPSEPQTAVSSASAEPDAPQ